MDSGQGFKKVGHKARNGRKRPKHGAHGGHRKARPIIYDIESARERHRRIDELRAAELDSEIKEF